VSAAIAALSRSCRASHARLPSPPHARSLHGQLWKAAIKTSLVTVECEGPVFAQAGVADLVKASLLKGLLPALPAIDLEDDVNLVNAAMLAAEVNLKVVVNHVASSPSGTYPNQLRVVVDGPAGQRTAVGAIIEGQPRIVQLDHWAAFPSFAPEAHVVMFSNLDKPGAVSRVTRVLADNNVNIASLAIARQFVGSPALTVIVADQRITSDVQSRIAELDGITNVRSVSFGNAFIPSAAEAGAASAAAGVLAGAGGRGGAAGVADALL